MRSGPQSRVNESRHASACRYRERLQLDSLATVRKLVEFHVEQHNTVMPHVAFKGLTPDEVYFERSDGMMETLVQQRVNARLERIRRNREVSCPGCRPAASAPKRQAA